MFAFGQGAILMDNEQILEILRNKGVAELYHANSVTTACTYLQQGALMSRQCVVDQGLVQTDQYSDSIDKKYGVLNDIFLDGVDIHDRGKSYNKYGPVVFVMSLDALLNDPNFENCILVAKSNPVKWKEGESDSDRYYLSPEELDLGYRFGDYGKSLLFRTKNGKVDLKPYLEKIILDDPECNIEKHDAFGLAINALNVNAKKSGLSGIAIDKRECQHECQCVPTYQKKQWIINKYFTPLS